MALFIVPLASPWTNTKQCGREIRPREKAVDVEMLMFSGREAQAAMSRLLDEIYGEPDQSSLNQAARRAETGQRHERVESCTSLAITDRVSQTSRHECSISTHEIAPR